MAIKPCKKCPEILSMDASSLIVLIMDFDQNLENSTG